MPRKREVKEAKEPAATKSIARTFEKPFRKGTPLGGVWSFIMWVVGVLVSLAVGFGMADYYNDLVKNKKCSLVFVPEINRWNGIEKIELMLKDIQFC